MQPDPRLRTDFDAETNAAQILIETRDWRYSRLPDAVPPASGLISPRRYMCDLADITPSEWMDFGHCLATAIELLRTEVQPDGFNVGWNVGYVAGQRIARIHCHVIPRFADEPRASQGLRYWLMDDNTRPDPGARGSGEAR